MPRSCYDCAVRDLAVLFLHLLATVARLAGPGGARSVVAESVLVKHQLLILNRSRKRSPKLGASDRVVAGLCALFLRPGRLIRSAIVELQRCSRSRSANSGFDEMEFSVATSRRSYRRNDDHEPGRIQQRARMVDGDADGAGPRPWLRR